MLNYIYYNQKPVVPPMYTDSDNSEDEGLEDYKTDGYHPVHIGEILLSRYIIMQKLGWGHFSTAWLAKDTKYDTYVAIKIQKSAKNYIEAAYDEVEILQELEKHNYEPKWVESVKQYWKDSPEKISSGVKRGHSQIVQLLNSFIHNGQNGKHFCMVFEIMGVTLLEIIKRYNYRGIPLPYVRLITKQILIGLDFLHRMCGIIHTDLKPENVLVCLTESELNEIKETGVFDETRLKSKKLQKDKDKDKDANTTITNDNDNNNDDKKKLTAKQLRKRIQKFKKRQKKKLENKGMSKDEVDKALNEMLTKRKEETLKQQVETDINTENYSLEDLIDRPRIASEPKYNLNVTDINEECYDDDETCSYEFEFFDYMKSLHLYTKERNRIISDPIYRKELMVRSKMIKEAKTEKEREQVLNAIHEKMSRRGPEIDFNIDVKICDVGNACWFNHHFSTKIQTRQYRSPEVLLGVNYDETADMWSLACMVFELVTGDFLFDPVKGREFSKNDDHLACFMRRLGKMPKNFALSGQESNLYFNRQGKLRRIHNIEVTSIKELLTKKYKMKPKEAEALQDFLLPMLEYSPQKRASARQMLQHPWLSMPHNFNYLMSDWELQKMNLIITTKEKYKKENNINTNIQNEIDVYEDEDDLYEGDSEDNSNSEHNSNDDDDDDSLSGDDNPDKIEIPNYNNSFAHYGQFVNLAALDRANPQFD